MRRLTVAVLAVCIISGITASVTNAKDFSVTLSTKVWSEYLGANGAIFHDKPVLQTDLFILLPKGFYLDFWHSAGLNDTDFSSDFGDEIDVTIGWKGTIKGFGVNVGISYFNIVELDEIPKGDVMQPYVGLNKGFKIREHSFIPYVQAEFPFPVKGGTPEKGIFIRGGIHHNWQPTPILAIHQKVGVAYDSGALGFEETGIAEYNVDTRWDVSKKITLDIPSIKFMTPVTSVSDDRGPTVVIGAGVTFHF